MHINNDLKYLAEKEFCTKYMNKMPNELLNIACWAAYVFAPFGHELQRAFCLEPCHLFKYVFPSSLH